MQLFQIQKDGNRYCGPSAISAIAGIGTKETAALLRSVSGKRAIISTGSVHMRNALAAFGFSMDVFDGKPAPKRLTLAAWARANARGKDVYLVSCGRHWVLVQGMYAICGKTIDLVPVPDHPNARTFVKKGFLIRKVAPVKPKDLLAGIALAQVAPKRVNSKRVAEDVARKYDIVVEQDNPDSMIWVTPPMHIIDEYDDHYIETWPEALQRVREYAALCEATDTPAKRSERL